MPNPHFENLVGKTVNDDTLIRSLRAQMDLMGKTGEKLVQEHRMRCAETLLTAGITLIPCDHLLDHQFAVSRGVYEAAKKIGVSETQLHRQTFPPLKGGFETKQE